MTAHVPENTMSAGPQNSAATEDVATAGRTGEIARHGVSVRARTQAVLERGLVGTVVMLQGQQRSRAYL